MLETIDNNQLNEAMNKIYNKWFREYKNYTPNQWTTGMINKCIYDMGIINTQYENYPVVRNLLLALWQELVARFEDGYKENAIVQKQNEGFTEAC